jgi:hypothetical protein
LCCRPDRGEPRRTGSRPDGASVLPCSGRRSTPVLVPAVAIVRGFPQGRPLAKQAVAAPGQASGTSCMSVAPRGTAVADQAARSRLPRLIRRVTRRWRNRAPPAGCDRGTGRMMETEAADASARGGRARTVDLETDPKSGKRLPVAAVPGGGFCENGRGVVSFAHIRTIPVVMSPL